MLKITYETEDGAFTSEFKNQEIVTWPDVMLKFANLLNAATFVIDLEVLDDHLHEAATEMRQRINPDNSNSWVD